MRRTLLIILIDDHPPEATAVVSRIRAEPGFRVLAASAEIESALRQVRETQPDLVLLNLAMAGDDSLTLAGALHGETPGSRVILMGLSRQHSDVAAFVRAGVSGFIMVDATFAEYLRTIHSVAEGRRVLPRELTRVLFSQLSHHGIRRRSQRARSISQLSGREQQVARLIIEGSSNKEIASGLQIALHTVKNHVHNVLSKLALNSRLEIAAYSQRDAGALPASAPALAATVGED